MHLFFVTKPVTTPSLPMKTVRIVILDTGQ